jgi:septation ring formation regulator EzrA
MQGNNYKDYLIQLLDYIRLNCNCQGNIEQISEKLKQLVSALEEEFTGEIKEVKEKTETELNSKLALIEKREKELKTLYGKVKKLIEESKHTDKELLQKLNGLADELENLLKKEEEHGVRLKLLEQDFEKAKKVGEKVSQKITEKVFSNVFKQLNEFEKRINNKFSEIDSKLPQVEKYLNDVKLETANEIKTLREETNSKIGKIEEELKKVKQNQDVIYREIEDIHNLIGLISYLTGGLFLIAIGYIAYKVISHFFFGG